MTTEGEHQQPESEPSWLIYAKLRGLHTYQTEDGIWCVRKIPNVNNRRRNPSNPQIPKQQRNK